MSYLFRKVSAAGDLLIMNDFNAATGKSSYFMHKNLGLGILCVKDMISYDEMVFFAARSFCSEIIRVIRKPLP
jgi:hypothetical protein